MMLKYIFILFLSFVSTNHLKAAECNDYKKSSEDYIKCKTEIFRNKSTDIKENAKLKFNKYKHKMKNYDIKEKLLKFKNSKSHKEFVEN